MRKLDNRTQLFKKRYWRNKPMGMGAGAPNLQRLKMKKKSKFYDAFMRETLRIHIWK